MNAKELKILKNIQRKQQRPDGYKYGFNAVEHKVFKKWSEEQFTKQRELPAGRNFRMWEHRGALDIETLESKKEFNKRYDDTFPNSPGSPAWWDMKFGI